jgi:hypothetical protein
MEVLGRRVKTRQLRGCKIKRRTPPTGRAETSQAQQPDKVQQPPWQAITVALSALQWAAVKSHGVARMIVLARSDGHVEKRKVVSPENSVSTSRSTALIQLRNKKEDKHS